MGKNMGEMIKKTCFAAVILIPHNELKQNIFSATDGDIGEWIANNTMAANL